MMFPCLGVFVCRFAWTIRLYFPRMLVKNKTVVKVILALDSRGLYILVCLNQSNNSNKKIRKENQRALRAFFWMQRPLPDSILTDISHLTFKNWNDKATSGSFDVGMDGTRYSFLPSIPLQLDVLSNHYVCTLATNELALLNECKSSFCHSSFAFAPLYCLCRCIVIYSAIPLLHSVELKFAQGDSFKPPEVILANSEFYYVPYNWLVLNAIW